MTVPLMLLIAASLMMTLARRLKLQPGLRVAPLPSGVEAQTIAAIVKAELEDVPLPSGVEAQTIATIAAVFVEDCTAFAKQQVRLHAGNEAAILLRNLGRYADAEKAFSTLLVEAEELCGEHSYHLSNLLKSRGILRFQQGRKKEAEADFIRMDRLRLKAHPGVSDLGQQLNDLERLIVAQLSLQHYADARRTISRLIALTKSNNRNISREILDWQQQAGNKKNAAPAPLPHIAVAASDGTSSSAVNQKTCDCCGKDSNLKVCGACHSVYFCSQACQRAGWASHKPICQSLRKRREGVDEDIHAVATANVSEESGQVAPDPGSIRSIRSMFLLDAISQNALAGSSVSPEMPVVLSGPLWDALSDPEETYFFRMGDVCSSRLLARDGAGRRFLATPGVLTCIAVFAWAPASALQSSSPVGVAAHIPLASVLRGVRACVKTGQDLDRALAPLTNELRRCFQGLDPASVHVTLVGGHRVADKADSFKVLLAELPAEKKIDGNDPRLSFSWYARAACTAAGLTKAIFDETMLNVFEGEKCVDMATEMRLRQANMRFEIAALDMQTGHVVTHTREMRDKQLLSGQEYARQSQVYGTLGLEGAPLTLVPHKVPATLVHGFAVGAEVEAHSLQVQGLNGVGGRVRSIRGERVVVSFPDPIRNKALKPSNLKLVLREP